MVAIDDRCPIETLGGRGQSVGLEASPVTDVSLDLELAVELLEWTVFSECRVETGDSSVGAAFRYGRRGLLLGCLVGRGALGTVSETISRVEVEIYRNSDKYQRSELIANSSRRSNTHGAPIVGDLSVQHEYHSLLLRVG